MNCAAAAGIGLQVHRLVYVLLSSCLSCVQRCVTAGRVSSSATISTVHCRSRSVMVATTAAMEQTSVTVSRETASRDCSAVTMAAVFRRHGNAIRQRTAVMALMSCLSTITAVCLLATIFCLTTFSFAHMMLCRRGLYTIRSAFDLSRGWLA